MLGFLWSSSHSVFSLINHCLFNGSLCRKALLSSFISLVRLWVVDSSLSTGPLTSTWIYKRLILLVHWQIVRRKIVTEIWVIRKIEHHLILVVFHSLGRKWREILEISIVEGIVLIRFQWIATKILVSCLRTILRVETATIGVYIIFVTFLIFTEHRLSIINAALICAIEYLFIQKLVFINTLWTKSGWRVKVVVDLGVILAAVQCKLGIVSIKRGLGIDVGLLHLSISDLRTWI